MEEAACGPDDKRRQTLRDVSRLIDSKRQELSYGYERSRLLGIAIDMKVLTGVMGFLGTAGASALSILR